MRSKVTRLLWSIWLLIFATACAASTSNALPVPCALVSVFRPIAIFDYDGQDQPRIACDGFLNLVFGYDGALLLMVCETESWPANRGFHFAKFAEFLAAEEG